MMLVNSLVAIALLAAIAYLVQRRNTKASQRALLAKFPLLEAYGNDALSVIHNGYVDYLKKDKPYRLRTNPAGIDDRIILPFKYIDEVKSSSETTGLSFLLFSEQSMLLQYSKGPCQTPACTYAVKQFLNRSLANLTPLIHSGISADMANILGQPEDWSSVVLYPKLISVVARNAARVLADPQLCDNEEWIGITVGITIQTFTAARSIRQNLRPPWYFLAPFLDQPTKDILKCRRRAAQIIKPVYEAHKRKASSEKGQTSQQSTGLTWLLSAPGGEREPSIQQIADDLLFLSIAGIHTTTSSLMIAIHDLISHPGVREPLRDEINESYPQSGTWKASDIAGLPKLDSFLKESQRMHPMGPISISRAPYKNFRFHDGLEIPARVLVGMSNQELNMDPDIHQDPNTFDAERFLKLKAATGSNKYAFTAVAEDISVNFGAGQHACPGRALAATAMKVILAELLTKYEVAFENPEKPPAMNAAPFGRSVDPKAVLLIRSIA